MDDAKLVQRQRRSGTFCVLPGQVERLARLLPGLIPASLQTPDLTKQCELVGMTLQPARTEMFTARLLQQRARLNEAPLERIRIAKTPCDNSERGPVAGGTTEGQALLKH